MIDFMKRIEEELRRDRKLRWLVRWETLKLWSKCLAMQLKDVVVGRPICRLFGHNRSVDFNKDINRLWCRRCGRHITFDEWMR